MSEDPLLVRPWDTKHRIGGKNDENDLDSLARTLKHQRRNLKWNPRSTFSSRGNRLEALMTMKKIDIAALEAAAVQKD
jgi:hypothetical protein